MTDRVRVSSVLFSFLLLKVKLVLKAITLSMATEIANSGLRYPYEPLLLAHSCLQCGIAAHNIGDGKKVCGTSRSAIIQLLHYHVEGLPEQTPATAT